MYIEILKFQDRESHLTAPERWEDKNLREYLNGSGIGWYFSIMFQYLNFQYTYNTLRTFRKTKPLDWRYVRS